VASIEPNRKDAATAWRVKWREGGRGGRATTVTCHSETQALKLKALVDEAGNVMPSRAVLDAYGLLWVLGEETEELAPAASAVTVSQLCSLYLAAKAASPKPPSPRTLKDYRQYVRDHIDSHWFGALLADDVDQEQARRWQAEIAAKAGYSNESAMKVRTSVVAPAFKWARISTKKDQVPLRTWSSPFEGLPMLETVVERQDRLESIDEIHAFITCAYEVDPNWGDLVVTKLCSGSRYGEITAPLVESLKPRGIELLRRQTNGTIRPGTKAGTNIWRFAPLPPLVLEIVKLRVAHLGQQDLIFWGPRGGKWAYQPYWRRWDTLGDLLRAGGIDKHLTGHCMRHTCNSELAAAGINSDVIRMMTGHARPGERATMTGHYTGWTRAMMDAVLTVTTPWVDLPVIRKRIETLRHRRTTGTTLALKPIAKPRRQRSAPAMR
jgi:integrase